MSTDVSEPAGSVGRQFKCVQCGGAMSYDAGAQALKCGYCNHTMTPTQSAVQGRSGPTEGADDVPVPPTGPREIPIAEGLARAPKGLGTQVQAVQCKECGATVNLQPNDRTAQCTYCASTMVMPVSLDPNLITPESLLPFKVSRERATEAFKTWLKSRWFRPNDLHRMARLDQIAGVYVPFWTFDARVRSEWTAERGWHYYETQQYTAEENGTKVVRTRQVQKTRWEPARGWRQDGYDDVLVCGSRGLPEKLADKLSTFDTKTLVAYSPGYLAGWRAESYAIDLPTGWARGQEKIGRLQQARCAGDVGGDTHRGLSVSNAFFSETFKHVLLPVHVAAYRYQNKPYRFLVNGQTGEVVGEAPLSFWKIFLTALVIMAAIAALVLVVLHRSSEQRSTVLQPQQVRQSDPSGYSKPAYP